MEEKKRVDLGPFTLEEAKEWLHQVEDTAWVAASTSGALEFILCNLLLELDKAKLIDGMAFIGRLEMGLPKLENTPQIAAKLILEQLRKNLSGKAPGGYVLH